MELSIIIKRYIIFFCSSILFFTSLVFAQNRIKLSAEFSEKMITIHWDSASCPYTYDVFTDYGDGTVKVNPVPITTRNRYSFFWVKKNGKKERVVKGNKVFLWVNAFLDTNLSSKDSCENLLISDTVFTDYFCGFNKVLTSNKCTSIIIDSQNIELIFPDAKSISKRKFINKYPLLASRIFDIYKRNIDPHDQGACVPFSTMVSKYFTALGIPCYRGQGNFITQFHSFNIVVIDGVEYIIDFTADQYLPNSSPVLIPREYCFVDSTGKPTDSKSKYSTKLYNINKIMSSEQFYFKKIESAQKYQHLLDSLLAL